MSVKALGKDKVISVAMPCLSKDSDLEDAKLVADTFDVKLITIDLTKSYEELEKETNKELKKQLNLQLINEANVNIKPRLRMTTLYAIAQTLGYLVIGTGNLCESMVGYTTKWGDNSSDFNPIGNFTVDEVLTIGAYLGVPEKILQKAPSDGLSDLTDEEKMGVSYKQIEEMIEMGDTYENVKQQIIDRYKASKHKRTTVPTYTFERKNFLKNY